MRYHSMQDIINICEKEEKLFWEVICEEDMAERQVTKEASLEKMAEMYNSMKLADLSYDPNIRSASGMVGGDGKKMETYNKEQRNLCSEFMSLAMEKALKMGESNACMKRIVAAPTAGSCGVIPSVLISYEECFHESAKRIVEALYVCAGIGEVIAENASISGAQGGCQAEIGSAAAMAGGALVYLSGGNNQQISDAVAFVLKGMLGLVCDPVCGLVEVPCIKRNVTGAVNAISASQLAMAGIHSVIPADEVIDAMRRVGNQMPECLKETAQGGLATSKKALEISEKSSKKQL